jgi:NAD-dependent dihydropyrimidine dehydrogenase PreA subunit
MSISESPRNQIPWFPTINSSLCVGDQTCVTFCPRAVFRWDPPANHPMVVQPYNCVVGCDGCTRICTAGVITFPGLEWRGKFLERYREAEQSAG